MKSDWSFIILAIEKLHPVGSSLVFCFCLLRFVVLWFEMWHYFPFVLFCVMMDCIWVYPSSFIEDL